MPPATHRQRLRLTTLALTRDVSGGKLITLREDRKRALARVIEKPLTEKKAARIIKRWESADEIPLALEQEDDYLRAYRAQPERLNEKIFGWALYRLCSM